MPSVSCSLIFIPLEGSGAGATSVRRMAEWHCNSMAPDYTSRTMTPTPCVMSADPQAIVSQPPPPPPPTPTYFTHQFVPPSQSSLKLCAGEGLQSSSSSTVAVVNRSSLPKVPPTPSLSSPCLGRTPRPHASPRVFPWQRQHHPLSRPLPPHPPPPPQMGRIKRGADAGAVPWTVSADLEAVQLGAQARARHACAPFFACGVSFVVFPCWPAPFPSPRLGGRSNLPYVPEF